MPGATLVLSAVCPSSPSSVYVNLQLNQPVYEKFTQKVVFKNGDHKRALWHSIRDPPSQTYVFK